METSRPPKPRSSLKPDSSIIWFVRVKFSTRTKHQNGNLLTIGCRSEHEARTVLEQINLAITDRRVLTLFDGTGYDTVINGRIVDFAKMEPRSS